MRRVIRKLGEARFFSSNAQSSGSKSDAKVIPMKKINEQGIAFAKLSSYAWSGFGIAIVFGIALGSLFKSMKKKENDQEPRKEV